MNLKFPIPLDELKARIQAVLGEVTELRRALHRIPEIHGQEKETASLLRQRLAPLKGLKVLPPLIGTDVIALLAGGKPGKNVTLRADIDALPLEEKSGVPWSSQRAGFAHSCGHDGHAAVLLGCCLVLQPLRDRLPGSVRFVFQPAEEETGGGRELVEKGLLEQDPKAEAVFALHAWPGIAEGQLSTRPGPMMAAADTFYLRILGKGAHAARPHSAIDPITTAAQVILALQTVVSRNITPLQPAVLSICSIHGGSTTNVIPVEVTLEGTTRCFDLSLRETFSRRMEEVIKGVCASAGADYRFEYKNGYIPLVNDPGMAALARVVVEGYLGKEAWFEPLEQSMGAEDFSYYLARVPGAYLRLGMGKDSSGLHHPSFDFNDRALEAGIAAICGLALEFLAGPS